MKNIYFSQDIHSQLVSMAYLRTATTHRHSLKLWNISAESFFFVFVQIPLLLEWIQGHMHDTVQDFSVTLVLDTLDHLVEDPGSW